MFIFFSTGPMVYGTCYSPISKKEELKDLNFAGNIFDRTGHLTKPDKKSQCYLVDWADGICIA